MCLETFHSARRRLYLTLRQKGGRIRRWLGSFSVTGDIREFRQRWNEASARLVVCFVHFNIELNWKG